MTAYGFSLHVTVKIQLYTSLVEGSYGSAQASTSELVVVPNLGGRDGEVN